MTRATSRFVLCGALVCLAVAGIRAQQTSTSTETKKFEVIAVEGNKLVVKLPEGTRELTVPADFKFNVDGKDLSVQELNPGMTGTATITTKTTSTPVTVTEVKNGTVKKTMATSLVVETDGEYKVFSQSDIDKRGITIMRDGKPAQISEFRAGDRLTATVITSKPPHVMSEKEVNATLAKSAPAQSTPAAAPAAPSSTQQAAPPPPPATSAGTTGAEPTNLPKTASPLPALGLAGLVSLFAGLCLTLWRHRTTH